MPVIFKEEGSAANARDANCTQIGALRALWVSPVIGFLRRNRYIERIWWKLHIQFPKLIPPTYPQSLKSMQERDPLQNEGSSIPKDEEVKALCVWGIEIYGPSEIDSFYAAVERLGWNSEKSTDQLGCGEWIKQLRQSGGEGSFNIGQVLRPGETKYLSHGYVTALPDGIEYLLVKIHQICPSLTCVQIAFVLDEVQQMAYATAIGESHATTSQSLAKQVGSYSLVDPYHHKERAIKRIRESFQAIPDNWFKRNMPGLFCTIPDGFGVATAELISSRNTHVLQGPGENRTSYLAWHRLLTNQSFNSLWSKQNCEAIRLSSLRSERDRTQILVSLKLSDLLEGKITSYGGPHTSTYMAFVNDQIGNLLIYKAATELLLAFRRSLMKTRDQLNKVQPGKRKLLQSLDFVQGFFSSSILVPSIAMDLSKKADEKFAFAHESSGFIELFPLGGDTPPQLHEALRSYTKNLATQLLGEDKTTREGLKQVADILTARESVKAQKRMEYLTVAAIAVALMSLWAALPANWSWSNKLAGVSSIMKEAIKAIATTPR